MNSPHGDEMVWTSEQRSKKKFEHGRSEVIIKYMDMLCVGGWKGAESGSGGVKR